MTQQITNLFIENISSVMKNNRLQQFRELVDFYKTLSDHRSCQVVFPSRKYLHFLRFQTNVITDYCRYTFTLNMHIWFLQILARAISASQIWLISPTKKDQQVVIPSLYTSLIKPATNYKMAHLNRSLQLNKGSVLPSYDELVSSVRAQQSLRAIRIQ
jgi:hypothetical protein